MPNSESSPLPDQMTHPSGGKARRVPELACLTLHPDVSVDDGEVLDALRVLRLEVIGPGDLDLTCSGPAPSWDEVPLNTEPRRFIVRRNDGASIDDDRREELLETLGEYLAHIAPVLTLRLRGRTTAFVPAADVLLIHVLPEFDEPSGLREPGEHGLREDPERSQLVAPYRFFQVTEPLQKPAYVIAEQLLEAIAEERDVGRVRGIYPLEQLGVEITFEHLPLQLPIAAFRPNDPGYAQQWNLDRIGLTGHAPSGWDLQQGDQSVTLAVLDGPVKSEDVDVQVAGFGVGFDSPAISAGEHGTNVAGIAAATIDNELGIAGVAGGCRVVSLAFGRWSDVEVAAGIRIAADHEAPTVLCLSAGSDAWNPQVVDSAIAAAHERGAVVCAATHNHGGEDWITYPATHPLVMACGASDRDDQRVTTDTGQGWGSNFGPEMSVVAPGIDIPASTSDGYGIVAGTSAATAQIAGLAALIRVAAAQLGPCDVRKIIEITACRSGDGFSHVAGYESGPWSAELGYGLVDARAALGLAPRWQPRADHCCDVASAGSVSAASGPLLAIPKDNGASLEASLESGTDVAIVEGYTGTRDAIRSIREHKLALRDGPLHGGASESGAPHVDPERLDFFDVTGRPLVLDFDEERSEYSFSQLDGEQPQQEDIIERLGKCFVAEQARFESLEIEFRGGTEVPVCRLRDQYDSFAEVVWDVVVCTSGPPWAHGRGWLHNVRHQLLGTR
jgi:hypothetical protein